jgi:hypothetical protein
MFNLSFFARVQAPIPLIEAINMNFSHIAAWILSGTSTRTPACSMAAFKRKTRSLNWLLSSPKAI